MDGTLPVPAHATHGFPSRFFVPLHAGQSFSPAAFMAALTFVLYSAV
jgi:hypothetical protein